MVRALVAGETGAGFCATRPAGHHAERDIAMGFCLFNNVAVAAELAIRELGVERVAIIDWDVHHGNGDRRDLPPPRRRAVREHPPGRRSVSGDRRGDRRRVRARALGYTINVPVPTGSRRGDVAVGARARGAAGGARVPARAGADLGGIRRPPRATRWPTACSRRSSFAQMACHVRDMAGGGGRAGRARSWRAGTTPACWLNACVATVARAGRGGQAPSRSRRPADRVRSRRRTARTLAALLGAVRARPGPPVPGPRPSTAPSGPRRIPVARGSGTAGVPRTPCGADGRRRRAPRRSAGAASRAHPRCGERSRPVGRRRQLVQQQRA